MSPGGRFVRKYKEGGRAFLWGYEFPDRLLMSNRIALIRQFAVRRSICVAALTSMIAGQQGFAAWRPTGPFGGDAEVVRTVPLAKDLVIAGARNGLIFTSVNGGASWNSVPFPAQFAGVLHALEVDPRSASVWYAGMESSNA